MQVCINCLNKYLIENRMVNARAMSRAGLKKKVQRVGAGKLLLSIGAFEDIQAN